MSSVLVLPCPALACALSPLYLREHDHSQGAKSPVHNMCSSALPAYLAGRFHPPCVSATTSHALLPDSLRNTHSSAHRCPLNRTRLLLGAFPGSSTNSPHLKPIPATFRGTSKKLHFLPGAVIIRSHYLGGLQQQKCVVSWFRRPEVYNRDAGRATLPLKALGKGLSQGVSQFWWFAGHVWPSLACRCMTSISASIFT